MENVKIVIPQIPSFKITLPGQSKASDIKVDSEMSDTSTNPVENRAVKGYVDNNFVKAQKNKGVAGIFEVPAEDGRSLTVLEVITSEGFNEQAIIPTYTSDLTNDSEFITREAVEDHTSETHADIFLEHNTMYLCGELVSLILTCSSDIAIDGPSYECSLLFKSGETPTVVTYSAQPMTWAGDDCDSDGHFAPTANKTYEISIKKFGDIVSARVGVV